MELDIEIFSRFLGLYILKLPIPRDIYEYVRDHKCPTNDPGSWLVFASILGAPDTEDEVLRKMVLALL